MCGDMQSAALIACETTAEKSPSPCVLMYPAENREIDGLARRMRKFLSAIFLVNSLDATLTPPSLPPSPPPPLSTGAVVVESALQLGTLINGAAGQSLELVIPVDTTLHLNGTAFIVPSGASVSIEGSSGATLDAAGLSRVFMVLPGGTLALRGLHITGGRADTGSPTQGFSQLLTDNDAGSIVGLPGSVITMDHCSLEDSSSREDVGAIWVQGIFEMRHSVVRNCSAGVYGSLTTTEQRDVGVIYVAHPLARAAIYDSVFSDFRASRYAAFSTVQVGHLEMYRCTLRGGRAFVLSGGINVFARVTLVDCLLEDMQSLSYGAMIIWLGGNLQMHNTTVRDTRATLYHAGAMLVGNLGIANVTDSAFEGCSAAATGGVVLVETGGTMTMNRVRFLSSRAVSNGGGLCVNGGSASLVGCQFQGCSADMGGGIAHLGGTLGLEDSSVSGCSAHSYGGGLFAAGGASTVTGGLITGCTGQGQTNLLSAGSALYVAAGGVVSVQGVTITQCSTALAPVTVSGGTLNFTDGLLAGNNGYSNGAFLLLPGGKATVRGTVINTCFALPVPPGFPSAGAVGVSSGAFMTMLRVTILNSFCISPPGAPGTCSAHAIHAHAGGTLNAKLLTLAPTCGIPFEPFNTWPLAPGYTFQFGDFYAISEWALSGVRGLSIVPSELPHYAPQATPPFSQVEYPCSSEPNALMALVNPNNASWPPCSATACGTDVEGDDGGGATCMLGLAVVGAVAPSMTTPMCTCAPPTENAPTEADQQLAPYTAGCVTPRQARGIQVAQQTASNVVAHLTRTTDQATGAAVEATAHRTLLLTMQGSAPSAATWTINTSTVPSWISTPLSGHVPGQEDVVEWVITLTTHMMPARDAPYEAELAVYIDSDVDIRILVPVYLFVQAEAGLRPCDVGETFISTCVPCLDGATCAADTLLGNISLDPGHWRISNASTDIRPCLKHDDPSKSPCIGGSRVGDRGSGYCRHNHTGPRCEVCSNGMYFDYFDEHEPRCIDCPPGGAMVGAPIGIAIGALVLIGSATMTVGRLVRRGDVPPGVVLMWRRGGTLLQKLGWMGTAKMLVGFLQVVAYMPAVYRVSLPPDYEAAWDAMNFLGDIGLFGASFFAPWACTGGFKTELIVFTVAPLGGIIFVLACGFVWALLKHAVSRRLSKRAPSDPTPLTPKRDGSDKVAESPLPTYTECMLTGMPLAILVALIFLPQAASKSFAAFNCRHFDETEESEDDAFLLADLSVQCWKSDEHEWIRNFAYLMIVVWPIGGVLAMALMLIKARKALTTQQPTTFSSAIYTLHKEYTVNCFYFETLILLQRIFLCGALLLIPDKYNFTRLLLAVWISVIFLVYVNLAKPFHREVHNRLYGAISFAYVSIFLTAMAVFLHNDVELVVDLETAQQVLGFESPDSFVSLALIFTAIVFLLALSLTINDLLTPTKTFRLKVNGLEPELDLKDNMLWHGFISHVWSTGQDATHVVVRQLQKLMPGVKIWLDVDCLTDIGNLEQSVSQSAVFMVFLSRGYFKSKNCRRELYQSIDSKKPTVLIHEGDYDKGGGPLTMLATECRESCTDTERGSEQITTRIFERSAALVPWVRLGDFQVVSLRLLAFELLKHTSYQKRENSLSKGLFIPGYAKNPYFMNPVHLVYAPTNKGAKELAVELQALARNGAPVLDFSLLETLKDHVARDEMGELTAFVNGIASTVSLGLTDATNLEPGTATHMLLYLNEETYTDNGETAEMVRNAQDGGVKIVMVQERDAAKMGVEFGHFFNSTPEDLVRVSIVTESLLITQSPLRPLLFSRTGIKHCLCPHRCGKSTPARWRFRCTRSRNTAASASTCSQRNWALLTAHHCCVSERPAATACLVAVATHETRETHWVRRSRRSDRWPRGVRQEKNPSPERSERRDRQPRSRSRRSRAMSPRPPPTFK